MTERNESNPPADLPSDAAAFWGAPPADSLPVDAGPASEVPVIDQLGSAPFKKPDKGGFPFLGFLASVYEHVSTTAAAELHQSGGAIAPSEASTDVAATNGQADAPANDAVNVPEPITSDTSVENQ
jgi:hypothetical protein